MAHMSRCRGTNDDGAAGNEVVMTRLKEKLHTLVSGSTWGIIAWTRVGQATLSHGS